MAYQNNASSYILLTLLLFLCVVVVFAGKPNNTPANDPKLIQRINSKNVGWKAKAHKIFNGKTIGELKRMVFPLDGSLMETFKDVLDKIKQHAKEKEDVKNGNVSPIVSNSENNNGNNGQATTRTETSGRKKKGKKSAPNKNGPKTKSNKKKQSAKGKSTSSSKPSKKVQKRSSTSPKRKSTTAGKTVKKTLKRRQRTSSGGVSTLAKKGKSSGGSSAPASIPSSFDAREKWPNCPPYIKQQFECGSCYAFAATGALAHRFCVASRGKFYPDLSPDYIVRCNTGTKACYGGKNTPTWEFLETTGVPTSSCVMYRSGYFNVQECPAICDDGSSAMQFYKTVPGTLKKLTGEEEIKRSIMTEGSVHTVMILLRDFINYDGGIYHMTADTVIGAHAVQLIGWGQENGEDYWLGVNSWGETWGLGGFFKIGLGQVGVAIQTHAAKPQL